MDMGLTIRAKRGYSYKQRVVSLLVCVVVIFVTFLSLTYIIKENSHDCTGEDCPVCAHILQCEHIIKQIGSGETAVISAAVSMVLLIVSVSLVGTMISKESLITRKVRMDN